MFAYDATGETELSMKEGEIISVLKVRLVANEYSVVTHMLASATDTRAHTDIRAGAHSNAHHDGRVITHCRRTQAAGGKASCTVE